MYQLSLADGANCGLQGSPGCNWSSLQISKPQAQLSKIEIGFEPWDQRLYGLKFYSKDGAVVLQTGYDWVADFFPTHTVYLEDGERVIGYKSRVLDPSNFDFQLIIGRLV